jgi:hypothetical protein
MNNFDYGLFFIIFACVLGAILLFAVFFRIRRIYIIKHYLRNRIIYSYLKFKGDFDEMNKWFASKEDISDRELKLALKGIDLKKYSTFLDRDFKEQLELHNIHDLKALCLERIKLKKSKE